MLADEHDFCTLAVASWNARRCDEVSDAVLRIIPEDPAFVPSQERCDAACVRLREVLVGVEVDVRVTDEITFVDAGANFESVACPLCDAEIDQDWWGEAVGEAAEGSFEALTVKVPCCGGETSLNDLRYEMPQGFARCVIEATNPNVDALPQHVVDELVAILGCELRVIWAHA
jgi:hypothetical protein